MLRNATHAQGAAGLRGAPRPARRGAFAVLCIATLASLAGGCLTAIGPDELPAADAGGDDAGFGADDAFRAPLWGTDDHLGDNAVCPSPDALHEGDPCSAAAVCTYPLDRHDNNCGRVCACTSQGRWACVGAPCAFLANGLTSCAAGKPCTGEVKCLLQCEEGLGCGQVCHCSRGRFTCSESPPVQ